MDAAAPVDVVRALAVLAEPPTPAHAGLAGALGLPVPPDGGAWADLFLFQLHPYASVHLGPEGMLGGEARARVAGFWRAVGRTPPAEPDHLAALLGLWAGLLEESETAEGPGARLARRGATALVHEHLLPWLLPFLDRVEALGDAHQAGWADLLRRTLLEAGGAPADAGVEGRDGAAPEGLPLHLREAPELPDPRREGASADFVPALLAPVRSGVILTRSDLATAARDVGLGLRAGERRYALEHLLGLEPVGILERLSELAGARAASYASWPDPVAPVRGFWSDRAGRTAALLEELAADARVEAPS